MNKLLKNLALLLPPVKAKYHHLQELQIKNEDLQRDLQNTRAYVGFLEHQLNNAIEVKKNCPLCHNEFWIFLPGPGGLRKNASCPYCGSLERHRAYWFFFEKYTDLFDRNELSDAIKVLHFAPEICFYEKLKSIPKCDYYPVDFDPSASNVHDMVIRDIIDIQSINYDDNMFDIIICNHVLEHVPDDHAAMKELYRVLKVTGEAYITVPLYESQLDITFEDSQYNTPELRLKHFGQHDHLRKYGKDFKAKLESSGFIVERVEPHKDFTDIEISRFGLMHSPIFKCTRN